MGRETINFKKLNPQAVIPQRATPGSSGMDLHAAETVYLYPGEYKAVATGLACSMGACYELQVRPRSGLAFKNGITVLNTPGTIDSDYRGEIKVLLINHGKSLHVIHPGDRIAQIVVGMVPPVEATEASELDDTSRGTGGFGSTGA